MSNRVDFPRPAKPPCPGPAPLSTVPAGDRSPTELLAEADQLFTEAEQRLADGDLAGYDELVTRAVALVRQANTQLTSGSAGTTTTTTTTTTAPEG